MRILADEHVPNRFVTALSAEGFEVVRVKEGLYEGASDAEVLEYAEKRSFVVLSEDRDFRGVETRSENHAGVIACDIRAKTGDIVAAVRTVDEYADDLSGCVVNVPGRWV
jgi:predicted nuclease of predicted toxin-antitoxin system